MPDAKSIICIFLQSQNQNPSKTNNKNFKRNLKLLIWRSSWTCLGITGHNILKLWTQFLSSFQLLKACQKSNDPMKRSKNQLKKLLLIAAIGKIWFDKNIFIHNFRTRSYPWHFYHKWLITKYSKNLKISLFGDFGHSEQ